MKTTLLVFCLYFVSLLPVAAQHKMLGADLSMLPVYEEAGSVYRDAEGHKIRPLKWLKKQGWNSVRVRLFVNPDSAKQNHRNEGVCQHIDMVKRFGRQVRKAGMSLMLDFHYSDTWADPGKQYIPSAWKHCNLQQMADSVYAHTKSSLQQMVKAGATPQLIQVGNEITFGMLWPMARVGSSKHNHWAQLALLLKQGVRACREVCPEAKIILHTERAYDRTTTFHFYDKMKELGVEYDIIGLSYYPIWHKSVPFFGESLDLIAQRYPDKPVMVVETAAYYSHENDRWCADPNKYGDIYPISVEGQRRFAEELVSELKRHPNVTGLYWWFAEENESGKKVIDTWLNRGLFDNRTGCALPAMEAFNRFLP